MDNKLPKTLSRNKSGDALKELQASYTSAYEFRVRSIEVLTKKRRIIESNQRSLSAFDKPAYSEFQADCNAAIRTIDDTLKEVFNYRIGEEDATDT